MACAHQVRTMHIGEAEHVQSVSYPHTRSFSRLYT